MNGTVWTRDEAHTAILALLTDGWLIGVEVFGEDDCCLHRHPGAGGEGEACESNGFGLCDNFGRHSVGSDCNSAEPFLLRPSRLLMTPEVLALRDEEYVSPPPECRQ